MIVGQTAGSKYIGEGTPPTIRTSVHGSTGAGGGTSFGMVVPSQVQTGDIGVATVITSQTGAAGIPATPSGWKLIGLKASDGFNTGTVYLSVFSRVMQNTDATTTVTFSLTGASGSTTMVGVMGLVEGSSGIGNIALCTDKFNESTNPFPQWTDFPSVIPGPQDLVMFVGGARVFSGSVLNSPRITSNTPNLVPSTMSIVENFSAQNDSITFPWAAWMLTDIPANQTLTLPTQVKNGSDCYKRVGCVLTFAPANKVPAPNFPQAITGGKLYGYGESLLTWAPYIIIEGSANNGSGQNYPHMSESIYFQRLKAMIQPANWNNVSAVANPQNLDLLNDFGIGGAFASDTAGYAYGTVAYNAQVGTADLDWQYNTAATWTPLTGSAGSSTLIILEMIGDDALHDAESGPGNGTAGPNNGTSFTVSPRYFNGALNSTDALVRLLRCSAIVSSAPTGTCVYSATSGTSDWTVNTSFNDVAANTCYSTTKKGATVTLTTTKANVDVLLLALDDVNSKETGAAFTITVDGVPYIPNDPSGYGYPTTTNAQMQQSTDGLYNQATHCPLAIPCHNLGAGTHTIVITHAGPNGGEFLYFNGLLEQALSPPPFICLNKVPIDPNTPPGKPATDQGNTYPQGLNWFQVNRLATVNTALPGSGATPYVTAVDQYNSILDIVQARFDGYVMVFAPGDNSHNPPYNWAYANTLDYVHPLDTGGAWYTQNLATFLAERIPV